MAEEALPMVLCENLVKIYKTKEVEVIALQGLDLTVEKGELTAIIGSSGSGKSTLLNMLGGLDRPSAGRLVINGVDMNKITKRKLQDYLLHTVGFVWQNNARNLVPYLSAVENVELPMLLGKQKEKRERALALLESVGMTHRAKSRLTELSGGEQQRVAIAIGLANKPKLLLADEPTGSVDTENTYKIMEVFQKINKEEDVTVLIVTHDMTLSRMVDRVVNIRDGKTSSEFIAKEDYLSKVKEVIEGESIDMSDTHQEMIVLDRFGRMQLPKSIMSELMLTHKDKLLVGIEEGRIIIEKGERS